MAENSIVKNICQQFIDYFGEDRVDSYLYNPLKCKIYSSYSCECCREDTVILVHWNSVTVSNEQDESVEIWDLYCATVVSPEGVLRIVPVFNRSTYDTPQWNSDYAHSHLSGINKRDVTLFRGSCLGSGPINSTIHKLQHGQHTDMDIWNLYCWELDKYVHVESLTGVPYRKIRNIGVYGKDDSIHDFSLAPELPYPFSSNGSAKILIKEFTKVLLQENVLKYRYCNGRFMMAMSVSELVLLVSNTFINWYNKNPKVHKNYNTEYLYRSCLIYKMYFTGSHFFRKDSSNTPIEAIVGAEMFEFKGNKVHLSLKDFNKKYEYGEVRILNFELLGYIVYSVLKYVNIKYGEIKNNITEKARIV